MTATIEGIYKKGMIMPLKNIKLKENTKVDITIKDKKSDKGLMKYAGAWKDYTAFDGRTLNDVKESIYTDREYSTRKEIKF